MLAAILLSGCLFETSDTVPFVPADAALSDADVDASGPQPDASPDASDASDMQDLTPSGDVCPGAPRQVGTPTCNPVTGTRCELAKVCDVGFDQFAEPDPRFFVHCRDLRVGELRGGEAGDACDPADTSACRPGTRCVQGECRRYCQLEDGLGCEGEQFCDVFFPPAQITHFGLCVDECGELR